MLNQNCNRKISSATLYAEAVVIFPPVTRKIALNQARDYLDDVIACDVNKTDGMSDGR